MSAITPGTCRYCGCTDLDGCRLPDGETCCWIDATRTVCSNPSCIRAHEAEKARARQTFRQVTRKLTPAEVHELIRNRGRKPRKGRAA